MDNPDFYDFWFAIVDQLIEVVASITAWVALFGEHIDKLLTTLP